MIKCVREWVASIPHAKIHPIFLNLKALYHLNSDVLNSNYHSISISFLYNSSVTQK